MRCGACLNACPVYREAGGHAYGSPYSGPIGAVISPLLMGRQKYGALPQASSLCGACLEACPARIDLPRMLIALRAEQVADGQVPAGQRRAEKLAAWGLKRPATMELGAAVARRLPDSFWRSIQDPRIFGQRKPPRLAKRSFRSMWAAGEMDDDNRTG